VGARNGRAAGFKVKHAVGAFGAALLIGSAVLAHEGATGIVKQRMDEMEHVGRVVKRINERLKSKRGLPDIERDAEEIRAAAARIPSLFPPGSRDRHSEAKPAIWDKWPAFEAASRTLVQEAEKLAGAARFGQEPAISAQFRTMTRSCSGCHDAFREKR
jgi:cytochrome c556